MIFFFYSKAVLAIPPLCSKWKPLNIGADGSSGWVFRLLCQEIGRTPLSPKGTKCHSLFRGVRPRSNLHRCIPSLGSLDRWQRSSPEVLPQAWGAWNIRQMQGLFKTITRATRKSAAPSAVSNPGVTLMPLVVEATDTHCRPEDLGAQTTPPKKEKGNSNHGTEQDEPTCQMNEGRRKPKTEFRQETGSGTYAELSKVQKE